MTRVILDRETLAKLHNLKERIEVCDEAGTTLGYFQPTNRSLYERVPVPFSENELKRFEQEPGGRSLSDIIADLEKRG